MGAARVAIRHGIRGYSSSVGTACAAGAQSIGEGLRLMRAGEADVVVCGCSEAPLFPTLADTFGNARALARGWADPTAASRPFDRRRNGLVLAEGAGVFVLERAEHADARGAAGVRGRPRLGRHHRRPPPDHARARTARAPPPACAGRCADAGRRPRRHRLRQRARHQYQARRRRRGRWRSARSSGATTPPVSSTKAVTGHMLGASGVVEAAVVRRGAAPRPAAADAQPRRPRSGLRPRPHPQGAARPRAVDHVHVELVRVRRPQRQPRLRPARPPAPDTDPPARRRRQ